MNFDCSSDQRRGFSQMLSETLDANVYPIDRVVVQDRLVR